MVAGSKEASTPTVVHLLHFKRAVVCVNRKPQRAIDNFFGKAPAPPAHGTAPQGGHRRPGTPPRCTGSAGPGAGEPEDGCTHTRWHGRAPTGGDRTSHGPYLLAQRPSPKPKPSSTPSQAPAPAPHFPRPATPRRRLPKQDTQHRRSHARPRAAEAGRASSAMRPVAMPAETQERPCAPVPPSPVRSHASTTSTSSPKTRKRTPPSLSRRQYDQVRPRVASVTRMRQYHRLVTCPGAIHREADR